jgi:hypothetical protein
MLSAYPPTVQLMQALADVAQEWIPELVEAVNNTQPLGTQHPECRGFSRGFCSGSFTEGGFENLPHLEEGDHIVGGLVAWVLDTEGGKEEWPLDSHPMCTMQSLEVRFVPADGGILWLSTTVVVHGTTTPRMKAPLIGLGLYGSQKC